MLQLVVVRVRQRERVEILLTLVDLLSCKRRRAQIPVHLPQSSTLPREASSLAEFAHLSRLWAKYLALLLTYAVKTSCKMRASSQPTAVEGKECEQVCRKRREM